MSHTIAVTPNKPRLPPRMPSAARGRCSRGINSGSWSCRSATATGRCVDLGKTGLFTRKAQAIFKVTGKRAVLEVEDGECREGAQARQAVVKRGDPIVAHLRVEWESEGR